MRERTLTWIALSIGSRQQALVDECRALIDGAVPAYFPVLPGGGKMHVRMLCLGCHWNARTYRYESTRTDYDCLPAPLLPDSWKALARDIAASVGMSMEPDVCIVNHYQRDGSLGLHQDKDESKRSIAAGVPVVSVSLGDTARFNFGGLQRHDEVTAIPLESGDAFVFGGPARLRFHGVSKIIAGTAPPGLQLVGRFNLTFRQCEVPVLTVDEDPTTERDLPYSRKPGGIRMTPEAWENFDKSRTDPPLQMSAREQARLAELKRRREQKPYPTKQEQQKQARERFDRMMSGERPGRRGR